MFKSTGEAIRFKESAYGLAGVFRDAEYERLQREITRFLARYSVPFLRVSLGLVFLGFGLLKFAPGVSPAEEISARTVDALSLGIVEGRLATVVVALMETAIGLCLVTGRQIKLGLALLGMAMVGVLSPLGLFPGDLFDGRYNAPTLVGQYVLKDIVLLAGTLVVLAWELNRNALMGSELPSQLDRPGAYLAAEEHRRDVPRPTRTPMRAGA